MLLIFLLMLYLNMSISRFARQNDNGFIVLFPCFVGESGHVYKYTCDGGYPWNERNSENKGTVSAMSLFNVGTRMRKRENEG